MPSEMLWTGGGLTRAGKGEECLESSQPQDRFPRGRFWKLHADVPRHACPAVGGPETDGHDETSAPASTVFGRLDVLAAAALRPAVRPTTSSRTHPPTACGWARAKSEWIWTPP